MFWYPAPEGRSGGQCGLLVLCADRGEAARFITDLLWLGSWSVSERSALAPNTALLPAPVGDGKKERGWSHACVHSLIPGAFLELLPWARPALCCRGASRSSEDPLKWPSPPQPAPLVSGWRLGIQKQKQRTVRVRRTSFELGGGASQLSSVDNVFQKSGQLEWVQFTPLCQTTFSQGSF